MRRFLAIFCFALAALPLAGRTENIVAKINPDNVLVSHFQGWGVSLCWWAKVVGGYSNRDEYADLVFKDLPLNLVRYNIGGGENTNTDSGFMEFRCQVPGFEPARGVWDWDADQNQRWMLKAALARGVTRVEAFANSPPYWMTISGSVTGATDGANNLRADCERDFVVYLAEVIKNLSQRDGIHFDTITPLNEPLSDWWKYGNHQEGCHVDEDQQIRLINLLHAELDRRGLDILIDAPEDNDEQSSVDNLKGYTPETLKSIGQISTHSYKANDPVKLHSLAGSLHKPLRQSEYGDDDDTGMKLARRIRNDLVKLRPLSWCYWQGADYSGWGLLHNHLRENGRQEYNLTEKYFVLKQFTHFLPAGCDIVGCGDTNSVAGYDPASHTLSIVTVNDSDTDFSVTYDLSAFTIASPQAEGYRTSDFDSFQKLTPPRVKNQQFTASFPSRSVTTLVFHNVTAK